MAHFVLFYSIVALNAKRREFPRSKAAQEQHFDDIGIPFVLLSLFVSRQWNDSLRCRLCFTLKWIIIYDLDAQQQQAL